MPALSPVRIALLGAPTLAAAGTASAGEWRLDPSRCPDLREDRIDQRVDYGRADRREDIRDMREVNCPASAWTYVPSRGERVTRKMTYTGPKKIYVGHHGYYHRPTPMKGKPQPDIALINIVIR